METLIKKSFQRYLLVLFTQQPDLLEDKYYGNGPSNSNLPLAPTFAPPPGAQSDLMKAVPPIPTSRVVRPDSVHTCPKSLMLMLYDITNL